MNTVWITGARGFLGRHVAKFFAEQGNTVAGFDLHPWEADERVRWGIAAWAGGDVLADNLDVLLQETGLPDVVFHAAGSGSVGYSFSCPLEDFERNVASTAWILDFLRRCAPEAYFILPSSAAVYGVQPPGPILEHVASNPVSPYGFHKVMAESLCRAAVENFGMSCAAVRYFSLYGPGLRKQLLWDLADKVWRRQQDSVELFGTGDETRDMLYVEDAARLAYKLAQLRRPGLTVVNGGTGVASSVREIAITLIEKMGEKVNVHFSGESRSGDPTHYQADTAVARKLGFEQRWSLGDGLAEYAEWLATQNRAYGRVLGAGAK